MFTKLECFSDVATDHTLSDNKLCCDFMYRFKMNNLSHRYLRDELNRLGGMGHDFKSLYLHTDPRGIHLQLGSMLVSGSLGLDNRLPFSPIQAYALVHPKFGSEPRRTEFEPRTELGSWFRFAILRKRTGPTVRRPPKSTNRCQNSLFRRKDPV